MIKHLLVPLDGSELAESVLPAVRYLSRKLNSLITLIHVVEKSAPSEVHGQKHLTNAGDAEKYLDDIAKTHFPDNKNINLHVHETEVKDVAKSIAEHAGEFTPDLIIMCSHGESGMRDMLLGSIARQVISLGETPILLIQPSPEEFVTDFKCEEMLIPLDGNPEHTQIIDIAGQIAGACGSEIHLIMAVPFFGNLAGQWTSSNKLLPGTTTRMLEMMAEESDDYLRKVKSELQKSVSEVTVETIREDPEDAIINTAAKINADIIVLATHSRSAMEAFWSGSVTAKVCKSIKKPVLLAPVRR